MFYIPHTINNVQHSAGIMNQPLSQTSGKSLDAFCKGWRPVASSSRNFNEVKRRGIFSLAGRLLTFRKVRFSMKLGKKS
jgi:hypothetical protein